MILWLIERPRRYPRLYSAYARTIGEWWIGKDLKGGGYGVIKLSMMAGVGSVIEEKTVKSADEFWTRYHPNTADSSGRAV